MTTLLTNECSICENVIYAYEKILITDCQHVFHRICAVERIEKKNRTDCFQCGIPSAIANALEHEQSIVDIECKICEGRLNKNDDIIVTNCQHTFHRICALERVNKKGQTKCRKCGQASATVDALLRDILPNNSECKICEKPLDNLDDIFITNCRHVFHRSCVEKRVQTRGRTDCHRCGESSVINNVSEHNSTSKSTESKLNSSQSFQYMNQNITSKDDHYCKCTVCFNANESSKTQCQSYIQSQSSLLLKNEVIVYINNLPLSMNDDKILEKMISNRLYETLQFHPIELKCCSKLGIGFLRIQNNDKDRLIRMDNILIDRHDSSTMIRFSEIFEIISYIVIDTINGINDWPNSEDVNRQWTKTYPGDRLQKCELVNVIFPNIYRIVSTSFDQLLKVMLNPYFSIQCHCAWVFLNGNCSYFEDLPESIDDATLRQAISNKIGESNISPLSLHLEFDKSKKNVCIIAADIARKWLAENSLCLGDKILIKKENLTCHRLLLDSVPENDDDVDSIVNHQMFAGKAIINKRRQMNLILEILDKNIFDDCIRIGVLHINNRMPIQMKIYVPFIDSDDNEIDANTWYREEMYQYTTNIMPFIQNLQHKIFHYQWNSQAWIEQFQLTTFHNQHRNHYGRNLTGNDQRHYLRMTVMLNTIGTIRMKKYRINEREFDLHLNPNSKTIVYNHQSKLELNPSISTTSYQQTIVKVKKEDCLIVYDKLVKKGKRPVVLNMANQTNPGGGYRKGDGAQEENLFRRSDYFRSLDIELDHITNDLTNQRYYCTSTSDLNSINISNIKQMYPMDDYGAIYTSDLTVFRQSEDTGYAFMENPLKNVCAIAMAAYRQPKLDGNQLNNKYAIGMRKKIENIFAIAYYHKHDCLVLSAFGCGAFRNPPDHVAKIFRSVIEQYAGFFEQIIFAIIDDHNTGHHLNPQGNFLPFQSQLDRLIVKAIIPTYQPNTIFGPYRFLDDGVTVSDVSICDLLPCRFGAQCNKMRSLDHTKEYSHPPWCTKASFNEKCAQTNDSVHLLSFIHRIPCEYGVKCQRIDEKEHSRQFDHPSFCLEGGACQNTSHDHEKTYRHLPLCEKSLKCIEYQRNIENHCKTHRHCISRCKYGHFCANFHNRTHMEEYDHPFPCPCPWTPYHCKFHDMLTQTRDSRKLPEQVQRHCLNYAHVCRYGRDCHDKIQLHWEKSIHVPRLSCPFGNKCNKLMQEDHLNSFTHTHQKIHDIRRYCKHADKCYSRSDPKHIAWYRHGMTFEDSGIICCNNLNENINFVQNQKDNIERVIRYITEEKWEKLTLISKDIINWIRTVQPVHRCKPHIFLSILHQGHVMSREHMNKLDEFKRVADSVLHQGRIRKMTALQIEPYKTYAYDYVLALVTEEYNKCNFLVTNTTSANYSTPTSTLEFITEKINSLSAVVQWDDMEMLRQTAIEQAKGSHELHSKPYGIGYGPDEKLQTNRHVFSILGPHLGHHYGNIVIVFKREVLHHPDANFSIQSATSYHSGNAFKWRPWLGKDPEQIDERVKLFHSSKLHASVPGYEYATAIELIVLTIRNLKLKNKMMDITLNQILDWWRQAESHQVIEAHLPQLIPLDYIDYIYIPQNIWDSFDSTVKHTIEVNFKGYFTVKHCPTDEQYNNVVCQELITQFRKRDVDSLPRPIKGTVMTIPSTKLTGHYLIPLTMSQAREQYYIDHPNVSKYHSTYIYWQAMNGDMMLTLSKEQIDPRKANSSLRYLICYVAKKPSPYDTDDCHYTEKISYLNVGLPVQHSLFISKQQFAARSRSLYVGCNTDDFLTFCLEIQYSTGMVILTHAGPNSIYNHETISCKFEKADMNLSELDFIYVSAGKHTVPIRNLIICFEKQADLHPTIDTNFNRESMIATKMTVQAKYDPDDNNEQPPKSPDVFTRMGNVVKNTASQLKDTVVGIFSNNNNSSLTPCSDGIYCLKQFSKDLDARDHNQTYSHPCRFAETCNKSRCNLTHEPRQVPQCDLDRNCPHLCDPIHRAHHRHTGWPYFLLPCRHLNRCSDKSDEHRKKYFHGERVLETTQHKQDSDRDQHKRAK